MENFFTSYSLLFALFEFRNRRSIDRAGRFITVNPRYIRPLSYVRRREKDLRRNKLPFLLSFNDADLDHFYRLTAAAAAECILLSHYFHCCSSQPGPTEYRCPIKVPLTSIYACTAFYCPLLTCGAKAGQCPLTIVHLLFEENPSKYIPLLRSLF